MGATNYNTMTPCGIQAVSASSATAVGLAVPSPTVNQSRANLALITCETNSFRWRDDGTDPTAAVGFPIPTATTLEYDGNLSTFKFISTAGTTNLTVTYYRAGG